MNHNRIWDQHNSIIFYEVVYITTSQLYGSIIWYKKTRVYFLNNKLILFFRFHLKIPYGTRMIDILWYFLDGFGSPEHGERFGFWRWETTKNASIIHRDEIITVNRDQSRSYYLIKNKKSIEWKITDRKTNSIIEIRYSL